MHELQNCKVFPAIVPGAIKDDTAFTSLVLDKADFAGADYLEFVGLLGSIDAEMALLKVMESDTKTNSTTLGGTPVLVKDATVKPGASDGSKPFVFGVNLRDSHERYLQIQATAGNGAAGTYLSVVAIASRPTNGSSDASPRGLLFAEYA